MIERLKRIMPKRIMKFLRVRRDKVRLYKIKKGQQAYCNTIEELRKRKPKGIIRVGIFMILGETWNSFVSLYNEVLTHKDIQLTVYVFPNCKLGKPNIDSYKSTISFFDKLGIPYVKVYDEKNDAWMSSSELLFDYLFYSLPYKEQYHEDFTPCKMVNKAKLCYIPYGFILTKSEELLGTVLRYDYLQYLYVFFSTWSVVTDYANKVYKRIGCKYHNVLQLGFPRFDLEFPRRQLETNRFTVLWIPRFAYEGRDPSENTSFFNFKDLVTHRIELQDDEYWIVRPHPLAFQTYIEKGIFTKSDITEFSNKLKFNDNAELDSDKDYLKSFGNSDAILADFSSLIIEYLMSEKPIIYCGKKDAIPMNELIECMYCVATWNETITAIEMLKQGNDPLKEKRKKLIQSLNPGKNSAKRIIDFILDDYKKGK